MSEKKRPSTALTATDELLPETVARRMYEWRRVFIGAPPAIYLQKLGQGVTLIETLDGQPLDSQVSYLAVETLSNRLVGVLRDGALDARPERIPVSRTRCTLFPAAKA